MLPNVLPASARQYAYLANRSRVVYTTGLGRGAESQSHERAARLKPRTRGVGD